MSKLLAIAFSDVHLHIWKEFNQDLRRTLVSFTVMELILEEGHRNGVPVLFTGDLLHNPHNVSNKLLSLIAEHFKRWENKGYHFYAIAGNHDQGDSSDYVKTFSIMFPDLITVLDNEAIEEDDFNIVGCPYRKGNVGLREDIKNLLDPDMDNITMVHTDIPGASDYNGFKPDKVDNMGTDLEFFFGTDLVLSGHIHKFQRLSNNIYMVGSTNQQRTSDSSGTFGYIEISTSMKVKFCELVTPGFKFYTDEPGDDHNYWVKVNNPPEDGGEELDDNVLRELHSRNSLVEGYAKFKGVKQKGRINLLKELLDNDEDNI